MFTAEFRDIFKNDDFSHNFGRQVIPRSILITGSQGMIGNAIASTLNHLIDLCAIPGARIFLASRNWSPSARSYWSRHSNIVLVENHEITKINKRIDLVIHAASPSNITKINNQNELNLANLGMLMDIYELNPLRIIYLSSGEVYRGENLREGDHSSELSPHVKRDWYPLSKLESETSLCKRSAETGTSVGVVRLFHTFGPGIKKDDGRSFADIIWGAVENRRIILHSPGNQIRTFLYLSDAVNGIIRIALRKHVGYEVANLGSTEPHSILEFASMVANVTDSEVIIKNDDGFLHSPNVSIVPTIEKMDELGWIQSVTLVEGITRTVNWVKNSIQ